MNLSSLSPEQLEELVNSGQLDKLREAVAVSHNNEAPQPYQHPSSDEQQPTLRRVLPSNLQDTSETLPDSNSIPERTAKLSGKNSTFSAEDKETPHLQPTRETGFEIDDPVELLFLLDDDIREGRVLLHDWQIQFMMDFAREWNQEMPFQAIVRAANGSGKDKYILAPCVVWLCMRFISARCVVTSSSGIQLDSQTDTYIGQLCQAANVKIHPGIWKCNYRYYECLPTGSPVTLFATDEPGKAEGYHPLKFGAKMALFESEAKTVPDEIHNAQSRCTGYTHRCLVSTPGLPIGHMYDLDSVAIDRKTLTDWSKLTASDFIRYHVTAYDCTHIPKSDIERGKRNLPGGEMGAAFKSQYLAEYGTTDEMVVIPYTYVWRAYQQTAGVKWIQEPFNKAGLDLSDGGDETVLTVRNGNKLLKVIPFKFDNTEDTIEFLNEKFREWELTNPQAYIYADCGGLGKPMLDRMRRQGWANIRYFDNRTQAYEPRTYRNRGAESWFHVRKLLERHELILYQDDKLIRQLATRYYKITSQNLHQLLSKLESRSRGYPSPDRADSLVLAFCDYKSAFKEEVPEEKRPFKQPEPPKPVSEFTLKGWVSEKEDNRGWNRNPSRNKDFSVIREELALSNALIRQRNKQTEKEQTV